MCLNIQERLSTIKWMVFFLCNHDNISYKNKKYNIFSDDNVIFSNNTQKGHSFLYMKVILVWYNTTWR